MPNWCSNSLAIEGNEEDIAKFKKQAEGTGWGVENETVNVLDFNQFVPMPQKVIDAGYTEEGWAWENANWGVKWGACESECMEASPDITEIVSGERITKLFYSFDTAWNPPIQMMEHWNEQYPNLKFTLEFEETGMAFEGECIANEDGVHTSSWDITPEDFHRKGWHEGEPEEHSKHCALCLEEIQDTIEGQIRKDIEEDYESE